jgi:tetratricopeptide (TPR) repeat protein
MATEYPLSPYLRSRSLPIAVILCLVFMFISTCTEDPETHFNRLDKEGDIKFAERDYYSALTFWQKALAIRSDASDIYRKIGKTHLRLADPTSAADAFSEAVHIQPDAWDVLLELGQLQLVSFDIAAAEASWEHLHRWGNKPEIHVFHGDLLVIKGRLDEAEQAYRKALDVIPDFELALIRLAACYVAQNKIDQAERTYSVVASLEPKSPDILLQMANYWKLNGNFENAKKCLLKAVSADTENIGLKKMLAEFYFDIQLYPEAQAILENILNQMPENLSVKKYLVEVLLAQNNLDAAQEVINELSREKFNDIEFDLLRGKYYLLAQEPNYAVGYFKSVVNEEPKLHIAHYLLGFAHLAGGQNELARHSLIHALTIEPHFSEAELTLADIYYKLKDYNLSLQYASRVMDREPENFRSYLIMGNAFLAQRQYHKALLKFEAARLINPEAVSPLYYLAFISEKLRKNKRALKLYRILLTKHPEFADAGMHYAQLLIRAGEIEKAKTFFEKTLKRFPQNGFLHHILGEIYLAADNLQIAQDHFEQATALNSMLVSSYLALANIHKSNQDWDKHVQVLEACINTISDCPEVFLRLARLYMQKGFFRRGFDNSQSRIGKKSGLSPFGKQSCLAAS